MSVLDLPFVHCVLASFSLPDAQQITLVSRTGTVSSRYAVYYTDENGGCFHGNYVATHNEATREFIRRIEINTSSRDEAPYPVSGAGFFIPLSEPDVQVSKHPALHAWR